MPISVSGQLCLRDNVCRLSTVSGEKEKKSPARARYIFRFCRKQQHYRASSYAALLRLVQNTLQQQHHESSGDLRRHRCGAARRRNTPHDRWADGILSTMHARGLKNFDMMWEVAINSEAVGDIRLSSRCCSVILYRTRLYLWRQMVSEVALPENMTSSTKPEVHNILHCHHNETEPQPWTGAVHRKFGHPIFLISSRTFRHTDTLTAKLHSYRERTYVCS